MKVAKVSNLRQKILEAKDIKRETIHIPEWGVELLLKGLSGTKRGRLVKTCTDRQGNVDYEKLQPLLVLNGAYDPETEDLVFGDADRDALGEKNSGVIERIAQKISELSGFNQQALDQAIKN